jgi:uracil-DNA glycosylase family 4
MKGFFTNQETQSSIVMANSKKLSCMACGLYKGPLKNPKLPPFGKFKKGILNIGEFTTIADDDAGKPFQGKEHGIYSVYKQFGIDIEEDCLNINAVMCTPLERKTEKQRIPTGHEIACCTINVVNVIKTYKPKLIVLFGKIALTNVIGHVWKASLNGIDTWRGFVIPDQTFQAWIAPVFSVSYVKIKQKQEVEVIWKQDIERALSKLNEPFPIHVQPEIKIIKNLNVLDIIPNHSAIAIDFETTGKKPHVPGHWIVTCSIAINGNQVYVFKMPRSKERRLPLIRLLKNPYIKKLGHNIKYEDEWSFVILGTRIKNWFWCSMQAAHILDNRAGITNLKFQYYINFGIAGYETEVNKWMQAEDDKNANSFNKMKEFTSSPAGLLLTLTYNAYDSAYEYRLAEKQMKLIGISL